MPTAHRRFTWFWGPTSDASNLAAQVRGVLGVFCDKWPTWYADPVVSGDAFGIVQFSITVSSRDQWWVQKRVRRLLTAVARHTDLPVLELSEDLSKLPPHTSRGAEFRKVPDGS